MKRSKVKATGRQNLKKLPHIWHTCLPSGGGSIADGSDAECKLSLTIVRPNLLLTPRDVWQLEERSHIMSTLCADIFSCFQRTFYCIKSSIPMLCQCVLPVLLFQNLSSSYNGRNARKQIIT